jgi:hypothetical protein
MELDISFIRGIFMNEQELVRLDKELDVKTICMYFLIFSSILYLIMYHRAKTEIVDEELGTNYKDGCLNTDNYPKYIALILLGVNSIFLYYSIVILNNAKIRQQKTGKPASLEPYYLFVLINSLQIIGTIITVYNVFVNDFGRVGVVR